MKLKSYSILLSIFVFIGCGGDSRINNSYSNSEIKIETTHTVLDPSQKKFYLEFAVTNNYPSDVNFELSNISLDLNACTISKSHSNQSILKFTEPKESHTFGITVDFFKPCRPTAYRVKAISNLKYKDSTNKESYISKYKSITIDSNLTIDTKSVFDYDAILQAVSGSSRIGLKTTKRYRLSLDNKDTNSTIFNINSNFMNENVNSITIKSSDLSKVKLIDPTTYRTDNEDEKQSLTFNNTNDVDLYIRTGTISGVANLDVDIDYTDNRGERHNVKTTTYLTILSGEPTAFSINSAGTKYNDTSKWFEEKFLISASDKYSNIVNIPSKINISAIADFRDSDGKGQRLLFGKSSKINGDLITDAETNRAQFRANSNVFNNINPSRDFLLLFGDVTKSEALGKWDIDLYNYNSTTLALRDSYNGENHTSLGFAIGHNYIKDICSNESKEWELKIDSSDKKYQLDENGEAYVTLKFPPYLIGKTIALSVNFSGEKRTGEVHFESLSSPLGVTAPETINIDMNTSIVPTVTHFFRIATGTEDVVYVRNAGVHCNVKLKNATISIKENQEITKYSDCQNGDIAFWQISANLIDLTKAGSVEFKDCQAYSFLNF